MVLDHLVVQQLGKENEEGDIDNMLLHGAAALYNTNADGTAETDIKYSSKDVTVLFPAMLLGDARPWTMLHNISSTRKFCGFL